MPDPQSSRPVRILQTRPMEAQEISGLEPALAPASQGTATQWKWAWISGGLVFALLTTAALTALDQPSLAAVTGAFSVVCFVASWVGGRPPAAPAHSSRVRISASRREGRRGVLWRSYSKNCPACQTPLGRDATITCTHNASHVIHRRCKDLMQGKCPQCGYPLR
jgi:hypothetical protein